MMADLGERRIGSVAVDFLEGMSRWGEGEAKTSTPVIRFDALSALGCRPIVAKILVRPPFIPIFSSSLTGFWPLRLVTETVNGGARWFPQSPGSADRR